MASFFIPAKVVKSTTLTKAVKVGSIESKAANALRSSAPKVQAHPVEGLKNAVRLHQNGKLSKAALNEAMIRANEAFNAQKGPDVPLWTSEMRKNFVSYSGDANGALSGARKPPAPIKSATQPPTRKPNVSTVATATPKFDSAAAHTPVRGTVGSTKTGKPAATTTQERGATASSPAGVAVSKNTRSDSPAVPTSTARRFGESLHEYLTRHGVDQSLSFAKQLAADRTNLRMSSTPERLSGGGESLPKLIPSGVDMALKMRVFSNTARAIADPLRFQTYLNHLDGVPVSTVIRLGNTAVRLNEFSLADRTREYRSVNVGNLLPNSGDYFSPQMLPVGSQRSHEVHTAFGAVSKVGEVNANGVAVGIESSVSWAQRGQLPGVDGTPIRQHWSVDFPQNWAKAETGLTALEMGAATSSTDQFANITVEPLRDKGFIPKGSALAARLERLEAKVGQRNELRRQIADATPAEVPRLTAKWRESDRSIASDVDTAARLALQSRMELLTESLGTSKTTYELTTRHAAAARYMKSIEARRMQFLMRPDSNRCWPRYSVRRVPKVW